MSRLYVSEEPQVVSADSTRSIGALSSVTWYRRGQSAWKYKVQLAGLIMMGCTTLRDQLQAICYIQTMPLLVTTAM